MLWWFCFCVVMSVAWAVGYTAANLLLGLRSKWPEKHAQERAALRMIVNITEATHKSQERAYTALSQIQMVARWGLEVKR